ncbi:hypothetical protein QQP08_011006 [Theobroma cacao]|nr:hypothetical protein QQP08_011006 [Theobroma cacao]
MPFTKFECSILAFSFIMSPLIFALAYDLLDLNASINIKWDIMSWTPEGYVDINNAQRLAHVMFLTCEVSNHSQGYGDNKQLANVSTDTEPWLDLGVDMR